MKSLVVCEGVSLPPTIKMRVLVFMSDNRHLQGPQYNSLDEISFDTGEFEFLK